MNLYTLGSDFFEVGGVYYLFMRTFDTTAWPHLNYGLSSASFAVREYLLDGETVLVYRTELTYGMDESTDMSAELKKLAASMKRKGAVPTPMPTSLDDVLSVASVVEIVTVTEALYNGGGANRPNKYVVKVNFTVDQLVWGTSPVELKDVYASAPYGTQVGDRLVVIFGGKFLTTEFSPLPHHVYTIDSDEAQTVLKYFGAEVSAAGQNDRGSMDASQIFRELPSNVENAVSGTVTWPLNAQAYGASYDLRLSENEISMRLFEAHFVEPSPRDRRRIELGS